MLRRLGISITARCNLNCNHCLQYQHFPMDITLEFWKRIIVEASEMGIKHFALSGGEPVLHPRLIEGLRALKSAAITYSLTTNGLLIGRILRAASTYLPTHITISLDGHNADTHDAVRGKGCFEKTSRNIFALAMSGIPIRIQCTILRPQVDHLEDLLELTKALGASQLVLVLPIPTERLVAMSQYPSYSQMLAAKRWVSKKRSEDPKQIDLALGNNILVEPEERYANFPPCSYLSGRDLFIDWNGRLSLCCQTSAVGFNDNEVIANLEEVSLSEALKMLSDFTAKFRKRSSNPETNFGFACLDCLQYLKKVPDIMDTLNVQEIF